MLPLVFFTGEREDYTGILRNGAIIGIVIGIIFVFVMNILAPGSGNISLGYLGAIGFIIDILIYVVIFFAGAFIGDWIERSQKKVIPE